jgi:DNA topoisomerase-1
VEEFIGVTADAADNGGTENASAADPDRPRKLLEELGKVKQWAAPVQRGRFTFDDKKFYTSVKKQFDEGRTLSPKQLNALEKLAEKYRDGSAREQ